MSNDLQLMYLMCSRFCHDLAAPLGAIAIGLEMLPEDNEPDSPQKILKYSIQSAVNKLELMRCLSGYATATHKPTLAEACQVIEKSIDPEKHTFTFMADPSTEISGEPVRLLLALMIIALDALPRGGEITVNRDFSIHLKGTMVKINDETLSCLTNGPALAQINSRAVVAYLVNTLCQRLGTKLAIVQEQVNSLTFKFSEA